MGDLAELKQRGPTQVLVLSFDSKDRGLIEREIYPDT